LGVELIMAGLLKSTGLLPKKREESITHLEISIAIKCRQYNLRQAICA
jgi:hypothetical protein